MATEQSDKDQKDGNEHEIGKPDQETLHTTDPQEHMEGPISSLMKKTGDGFEKEESAGNDEERNS